MAQAESKFFSLGNIFFLTLITLYFCEVPSELGMIYIICLAPTKISNQSPRSFGFQL